MPLLPIAMYCISFQERIGDEVGKNLVLQPGKLPGLASIKYANLRTGFGARKGPLEPDMVPDPGAFAAPGLQTPGSRAAVRLESPPMS